MTNQTTLSKQLYFIDSAVLDSQKILDSLTPDSVYRIIDSTRNGLQQIADIVSNYTDLEAIHIISHGASGSLQLGNSLITQTNLAEYNETLATIGNALTETGDLLLYGCDVAQGETGQAFIQQIATLTRADVAASEDLTGAANQGGDWVLEQTVGQIETNTLQSTDFSTTLSVGLANQTQDDISSADLSNYIQIGTLFSILSYGDGALSSGSVSAGHSFSNYASYIDEGFNDNYRSFFAQNAQLGRNWTLLTDDFIDNNPYWLTSWNDSLNNWLANNNTHANIHASFTTGGLYNAYCDSANSTTTFDQYLSKSDYTDNVTGAVFPATNANDRLGDSNALLAQSFDSAGNGTLVLTFRGTDEFDSAASGGQTFIGDGAYLHYEAFRPLIDAAFTYAATASNNIKHIIVSGHSLGGAMADIFTLVDADRFAAIDFSDLTIVSLASPGLDPDTIFDNTFGFGFNDKYDQSVASPSSNFDPNLILNTQSIGDFYHGFTHERDRVYFAQKSESDLGTSSFVGDEFTPNLTIGPNTNFDATELNLPTIINGDVTYDNQYIPWYSIEPYFIHGFGAHHNGQIYWRDIHELYSSPLFAYYNTQKLYFGRGQFAENQTWFTAGTLDDEIGIGAVDKHGVTWNLSGNDFILGLEGNDNLHGREGDDLLDGGAGNDTLVGGIGIDTLYGGKGDDIYYIGDSDHCIENLNEGVDTIFSDVSCVLPDNIENLTLVGLPDNLNIQGMGNGLANIIIGNQGNNIIKGFEGADSIEGGAGDDTIYGDDASPLTGGSNDTIQGGIGDDTIYGGEGNDFLQGGSGLNYLYGGINNDVLISTDSDYLFGGANDDEYVIDTSNALARIQTVIDEQSQGGNDKVTFIGYDIDETATRFYAQPDNSLLIQVFNTGGAVWADIFIKNMSAINNGVELFTLQKIIYQQSPHILAQYNLQTAWSAALAGNNTGGSALITSTPPASYWQIGNNSDNVIYGNDSDNYLLGMGGNDTIFGLAGGDFIDGGADNDTISVIANSDEIDIVSGGTETDSLSIDFSNNTNGDISWSGYSTANTATLRVGANASMADIETMLSNTVTFDVTSTLSDGVMFDGIENLSITGSNANDLLIVQGNGNYDGKAGIDTLYADWSSTTNAININNTSQNINGSTISNIERWLVKTGSDGDVINTELSYTIPNLFNTGAGLTSTSIDSHYNFQTIQGTATGSSGYSYAFVGNTGSLMADSSTSHWLIPSSNMGDSYDAYSNGIYKWSLQFDLTGYDPSTAFFTGKISVDNTAVIKLNGNQISTANNFQQFTSFTANSGFVSGINTLEFQVTNLANGFPYSNPTGLRVEFTNSHVSPVSSNGGYDDVVYSNGGNDIINTSSGNDTINAGAGNDTLNGGAGNDYLNGGDDIDSAVYLNAWANYAVTGNTTNAIVTALNGVEGTDTLTGIENLVFNGVTVSLADAINDNPVGVNDSNANDPIIEAGSNGVGDAMATGNVLANDTDADSSLGLGETKTVKAVNGQTGNVGVVITGIYGSLILSADGTYTYTLDDTKAAINTLVEGQIVTDSFNYTVQDAHGLTGSAVLNIAITGSNDAPTGISISNSSINENVAANTVIGTLSSTDPDANNTFTYSLVAGGDSGAFSIVGNELRINNSPNFETKPLYNITVRSTDQGGLFFNKALTITVNNLNETLSLVSPTVIDYIDTAFVDNFVTKTGTLATITEFAVGLTYGITGGTDNLDGTISKSNAYGTLTITSATGAYSFVPNNLGIEALNAYVSDSSLIMTVSDGVLTDSKAFTFTITQSGNTESNGNDALLGTVGTDHWAGLAGNDTYYVDNTGDVITEQVGEGTDIVYSTAVSYTLSANVENLVIWGTGLNGTGNGQNNTIFGNALNNRFDGLAGDDMIDGLGGSDIINGGTGNDILDGGVSDVYNLGVIDTLNGEAGNDTFLSRGFFGAGNYNGGADMDWLDFSQADSYTAGRRGAEGAGVNVDLTAGKANSYYRVADNFTWLDSNGQINLVSIENVRGSNQGDRLFGDGNVNTLEGGAGNDTLYGAGGLDTLIGGAGNDSYYVGYLEDVLDAVIENAGEGADGVLSALSHYTLADHVESLGLLTGAINGTGNAENNYILGNNANNSLDGGTGIDTLVGGLGNDIYYVDHVSDVVVENVGGGWDKVYSTAVAYRLSTNIEVLILTGAALNGIGNAENNILFGNTANNHLDGGTGSDTINGGVGDDTLDGGVSDVYNLGVIDTLNGEAGNDTFLARGFYGAGNYNGGADMDWLDFSQADSYTAGRRGTQGIGVNVDLATGKANSYYRVADNFTWLDANGQINLTSIENVRGTNQGDRLFGDGNVNTLEGGAGNDVLYGAGGLDTLIGGAGNDTYYVGYLEDVLDAVIENAGEGKDGVWSALSHYTLADHVESLSLLTGAINGTGNAENNYILGNTANNNLTGGDGADSLVGGLGKDSYHLSETTPAIDTVSIAVGDSLVNNFDLAHSFSLGTGTLNTTGVDKLDLASGLIAANTAAVNGINSGIIASHHIQNGIISFDDIDSYNTSLNIAAADLPSVFGYLQANIGGNNTVAFVSEGNTFVFQDGGINDTLVELVGVIASSVNNTGLAAGAVWVV